MGTSAHKYTYHASIQSMWSLLVIKEVHVCVRAHACMCARLCASVYVSMSFDITVCGLVLILSVVQHHGFDVHQCHFTDSACINAISRIRHASMPFPVLVACTRKWLTFLTRRTRPVGRSEWSRSLFSLFAEKEFERSEGSCAFVGQRLFPCLLLIPARFQFKRVLHLFAEPVRAIMPLKSGQECLADLF